MEQRACILNVSTANKHAMNVTRSQKVQTLVLSGYGLNCEEETAAAFKRAGSHVTICHINALAKRAAPLSRTHILAIPGGFSYGDHLGSGKVFAQRLLQILGSELKTFIAQGRAVIGICNGFQILIQAGILPGLSERRAVSLITNSSAQYEDRWVRLRAHPQNQSFWLHKLQTPFVLPARHGEGRLITASAQVLTQLQDAGCIALQYLDRNNAPTQRYPANPNGSQLAIAALTNTQGNVLGIMPHPDAAFYKELIPVHLRHTAAETCLQHQLLQTSDGIGMVFFYNAVRYVKKNLLNNNNCPPPKRQLSSHISH